MRRLHQLLQDPSALIEFGGEEIIAFPFLGVAPLTATHLLWSALWTAMIWAIAAAFFLRKSL